VSAPGTLGNIGGGILSRFKVIFDYAIESMDGAPAGEIGVPALRERFRREGQEIRLGIRRGTVCIAVTLRTRRMI